MRKFYDLSGKHFFALANSEGAGVAYPPVPPFSLRPCYLVALHVHVPHSKQF